ncbi:MAG: asparaginase domain-containing protein [Steroidobacteraceae bacterium]
MNNIAIFTTGGTIDKIYFDALSDYQIGATVLPDLLRENNVHVTHKINELMRKDSLDLNDADRTVIHAAVATCTATQVLITHGTDTMINTARVLADIPGKTIVLTGAMQPAALKCSDAQFNVGFALAAVQTLPHGVYIAMHGQVFDPRQSVKDRTAQRFIAR